MIDKKQNILIVDDEPGNLQLMGQILREDYDVSFAINGEKALELVEKISPDLILLDVMMPKINGYEVCQQLQENQKTKKIPVIFVTTKDQEEDETKGLELGAVDYISKPVSASIVKARVKNHLELKQAREEVERQNERLKVLLQMREDMGNMIVHDMRTPLSSILGYTQLLSMRDGVLPQFSSYLKSILNAGNSLNSFINDLLVLAKTENEKLSLNYSQVEIKSLLEEIKNIHNPSAELKKINLLVVTPEEPCTIKVDAKLFHRVLDNLITNALKFTQPNKSIILRAEYLENHSKQARFQVIDEGPGIPPEQREQIFDKFAIMQLKKKGVSQIGLGLAFCKVAIDAHEGEIFMTANEPQGSIFTIEI